MPRNRNRDFRRLSRGLRFRLTASYALFFAVLMTGVAALFRGRLAAVLSDQVQATLEQEWAALKGYLRVERNPETDKIAAYWYYDEEDPDESRIVLNIRRIYLLTDANGNVIPNALDSTPAVSTTYAEIGIDPPARIQARVRELLPSLHSNVPPKTFWEDKRGPHGAVYRIRGGIVFDELHHAPYYVAIGTPLNPSRNILREVTWIYVGVVPGALILGSFLGWIMAGRALTPVLGVARTAQRISGSNLSLRIPTREAGDELDYLILTFNRMIERLESSFEQMKQFSADVSHELRTPITGIRGQLEVALFTAKTIEQYREAMFNALQDIDRLSQIVRALLLLSQAESGQLVLQKTHLNVCEVAEDLGEQFQIPAEAAGVRLTVDLSANCGVQADRVQIERLISNLLSNAIKFTPEGGKIRMSVRPSRESVEIVIEDTGCGIPTEHLPHIFDRFYRVPGRGTAPGAEQGLGLGLSFAAWIVKAHRGTIDVDSTPGKGTRFTIKLPAGGVGSDTMELAGQPTASS